MSDPQIPVISNEKSVSTKKKQQLWIGLALLAIGVVSIGGTLLFDSRPKKPTEAAQLASKPTTVQVTVPGGAYTDKDSWRAGESARIADMQTQLKTLDNKLKEIDRSKLGTNEPPKVQLPASAAPPAPVTSPAPVLKPLGGASPANGATPAGPGITFPPGSPSNPVAGTAIKSGVVPALAPPAMTEGRIKRITQEDADEPEPQAAGPVKVAQTAPQASASKPVGTGAAAKADLRKPLDADNYLPAGTFIEGRLLSGMDAPTGGQAQNNPMPMLIELTGDAFLPSRIRSQVKGCFVFATAYGDLSSERANARTETLSCVKADGTVIELSIKGFVAGEDGKAGIKGRLVSKQGQVLGNALLAGVVSGIGNALSFSATTTTQNPLGGVTTTPKPGEEARAGFGQSFGKSMDRLATYYISLADKMFPVIEVDAQRQVTIVLTKGVAIDNRLDSRFDSDTQLSNARTR